MRAGRHTQKIVFQTYAESATSMSAAAGGAWSDTITTFAENYPLKSSENVESARLEHKITDRWRVRYQSGIQPDMRIKWVHRGTTRYQKIISIVNIGGLDKELEVLATEVTA